MRIDLPACGFKFCKYSSNCNCINRIEYERCEYRRYKDTGMEPEDINTISGLASENCSKAADAIDRLLSDDGMTGHVSDLLSAEKEGRLVVLESKPIPTVRGDSAFDTDAYCPNCGETVSGYWRIDDTEMEVFQCPHCGTYVNVCAPQITREEAEAALRGEEK